METVRLQILNISMLESGIKQRAKVQIVNTMSKPTMVEEGANNHCVREVTFL